MSVSSDMKEVRAVPTETILERTRRRPVMTAGFLVVLALLVLAAYWQSFVDIYNQWKLPESLYSHAPIIPPISAYFVWRLRRQWLQAPATPAP